MLDISAFKYIKTKSNVSLRTATFLPFSNAAKRGVCVLLHGRTECIEKYEEVIGELLIRGFIVATFDWRGQGGSSRNSQSAEGQHIEDFSDYDEDLDSFLQQIVEPLDGPCMILAHSMGGNIAIRALSRHGAYFSRAVFSAPMIALHNTWLIKGASSFMKIIGHSTRAVVNRKSVATENTPFEKNLLTSDRNRYDRMREQLVLNPDLRVGPPTWGWLSAAIKSMNLVKHNAFTQKIQVPFLVCGAGRDKICDTKSAKKLAGQLPNANYVEFPLSKHEILMETDEIRTQFWSQFDSFCESPIQTS